ncbi:DUF1254 domain-containing protein [Aureliella helgolandensis]|uniref:DUF1254 domain-containing protein n=1 Tax=Aureliella helgolandensis TaxID=2527968 RepID=A0A518G1Q8_9BACT|nr:DUF1254 domain-containing protein [Aureliella helgolandensis]QDV22525.1 hypothetical protein Q31a_08110 [Aureliella helgolandensis]
MKYLPEQGLRTSAIIGVMFFAGSGSVFAQVSQETLKSIGIPDKVETPIGKLEFFDGVPTQATVETLYDNLDRMRAVEVYLNNQGAASLNAMRKGNAGIGADASNKVTITEQLLKPESLYLTGNTSTLYALTYLDLKTEGPLVVELPPGMLGFLDDAWFRFIDNLGVIGPDKGKGGKYLLLPPDYSGDEPEGYFIVKLPTYNNLMFLRGSIAKGLPPAVENIKSKLRIYPLAKAANPPATEFINISGKSYSTIVTRDFSFFEDLNELVQVEPIDAIGPEMRGQLAAIGIVKGKLFNPDTRMKQLLSEAANIGNATARAITYQPRIDGVFIYPDTNSAWTTAYANKNTSFEADGTMNLDARPLFYFNATGVTPAMATSHAGAGSDYALAYLDADKNAFDGSKTYKLHLPPNVPINNFWAVTLYDTQTRSLLQTSQTFPTVGSQSEGFQKNEDGSYDVYFGPKAPEGKESNWLETIPGKSWFTILRLYGPLEPWISKTWRPSEIEPVK